MAAIALVLLVVGEIGGSRIRLSDDVVFGWARPTACAVRVDIDAASGVRGLVTTRAAQIGEVLLEVPLDKALADADAGADPLSGACGPWARHLPPHTQLALALIREWRLGDASAWAPYLASLPADGALCLPKDMSEHELAMAQDVRFEMEAESLFFAVHSALDEALDAIDGGGEDELRDADAVEAAAAHGRTGDETRWQGEPPSAAEFQWAMSLVWTRCLRLDVGPCGGVRRLLVPCVDMANHDAQPSAFFASAHGAGAAAVRLHAARALSVGDEVTLSYGEGSAEHWAQHYAFVPRKNPYDGMRLCAHELDAEVAQIAALAHGGAPPSAVPARGAPLAEPARPGAWAEPGACWQLRATGIDVTLFAALRAQLTPVRRDARGAPATDAAHAGSGPAPCEQPAGDEVASAWAERPLAPAREAAVADAVASACERKLRALPTSVEEDEAVLATMPASERARLLVELRLSRKRLLNAVAMRMHAYARAQRAAAEDAARGAALWMALEAEARELSAFPELDRMGVDALREMTLSSSSAPALMFALVAGS
ncbi:hypothetical protein KFE25_013698 [Diacronema lutheri]|uniref:Rubisco LSMT substrate-binding domain-containing protein n=3 Tax=Diacronema lutheri TaxID=2081491 RepID=A0A8J5XVD8_DIALT|nr:hypothetical protein KFE25_013698 [Diacronema lutheri]